MISIEKIHEKIKSNIWQGIAQSNIDLSSLPNADQEKMVAKISEKMMDTFNTLLDEVAPEQAKINLSDQEGTDAHEERILWRGRPFLSLVEDYVITNERIKIVQGLLSKDIENFELIRVQDIDLRRAAHERLFNLGDIHIMGHDPSDPSITLRNISDPEGVYELLRRAWLEARKRHGLQFREFM